jgi:hypothetical protein
VLFFVLVYLALLSLSSLPLWREERALFLRERASGVYGTGAYFFTVVRTPRPGMSPHASCISQQYQ